MAQLTKDQFTEKYDNFFADNNIENITEETFREFRDDVRDTFALAADLAAAPIAPAVNFDPLTRMLTASHVLGTAELEYTHNNGGFSAYAPVQVDDLAHGQGEWRYRVKGDTGRNPSVTTDSPRIEVKGVVNPAGPGRIKSTDISDSTEAGRALLTAADVAAQRVLLDQLHFIAGQYGAGQPKFDTLFGEEGALVYLLRRIGDRDQPDAPTDGQVDDTADTFSFLPNPAYPSFAQYKVAGLPGITGAVVLDATNSYVQAGRIYIKVVGAVPPKGLAVYVAGSGNVPDGKVLTNADPFTGTAVVVTPPAPTNQAPTVNLTGSSSTVNTGQGVTLTASPYDADGTIAKVEYFDGGAKIGETFSAPWSILTPGLAQGTHNFTARTTDDKGATGTSIIFSVAVSTPQTVYNGSYTARCGTDKAGTGPEVYRTASGTTQSEADAAARNAAIAALVCSVKPTYEWTLTGPSDSDTTGITLTTDGGGYLLQYNRIFNGDSTAKRMDIYTPGTGNQLAAVDFPAAYVGQGFLLVVGGITYGGTFLDGTPTLTTY
jgi:hypothetical protein